MEVGAEWSSQSEEMEHCGNHGVPGETFVTPNFTKDVTAGANRWLLGRIVELLMQDLKVRFKLCTCA